MSEDQIQAFINAVKSDSILEERLRAAADLDAVVAIAKESGFAVTSEEVLKAQAQHSEELSDEELEVVAGGASSGNVYCKPPEQTRHPRQRYSEFACGPGGPL